MNIDEYVDSLIKLTKDNTIILSENEIQPGQNTFADITCGQLQRREFFYLSSPCYLNGRRVIGILLLETGVVIPFFQGEEDDLRDTIRTTLLGYTIVKSFTLYQIAIDDFISDDKSIYILTNANNIRLAGMLYAKLSGRSEGYMHVLYSVPFVIIKLPYTDALPRYSALYIEGNEVNIEEINDEILKQILYKTYKVTKKILQHTLENNPQLARLIEQLEI